jgi:peptidoglycan glycosyltransferase
VNVPITRLYAFLLILFALLVYFTSKWAVFDAESLEDETANRRPLIEEQQVPRGTITTSDGVLIAESNPQGGGPRPVYVRNYPEADPSLFGNPVGYSFVDVGRTGIEQSENDILAGEQNEFASILDQIRDVPQEGGDLTITIDAEAQQVGAQAVQAAIDANSAAFPENQAGSVVAIEPDTGAVRAMVSVPGFDPNAVQDQAAFQQLNDPDNPGQPLLNRATQAQGYPPGSTMKVVTAAAGLDSGEITPDTVINADSPKDIGGFPLQNFGNDSFGDITATAALTDSVNTYWAQVGERLGQETYFEYMDRFGFNADPGLDYPDNQMTASGVELEGGGLAEPDDPVDIGRVAIGQGSLNATPLQMAEVAATVANDGTLMQPTFLQEAKDPDGRTIEKLDPDEQSQVMSEEAASQLQEMMTNVVNDGTAAGLSVVTGAGTLAGKTGTAEINPATGLNQPWFIGFAPVDDPQIAVAATIERCTGCFGGEVAGPIATAVMDSLLSG